MGFGILLGSVATALIVSGQNELNVSQRTLTAAEAIQKTPVLVLCIDGLDTKYGTSIIFELIRIGDPGL